MLDYYVYILASRPHGTLHIGVTDNLIKRVHEHKNDVVEGFTQRYAVHLLVHYEVCTDVATAISWEKRLKKWNRAYKIRLIDSKNPEWRDLYHDLAQ